MIVPVDTGRKLNVHKTFRGRPARLMDILCTLGLRPVSAGVATGRLIDSLSVLPYDYSLLTHDVNWTNFLGHQ